ncbi:hypothetical protein SD373_000636 [Cronobacter sakazakii]|nr:hypothetical protein [Cronobacter sakazakii]ELU8381487.1 hypothetical protein [Cronobacter sakazakii]ELU8422119.1 hypothetical protein [Cronobacter sakazakii]ELU8457678.1 hypothetical protein [Cronobacter sakazakii]ELU8530356.1 hypothetical protein [Cronobacter sakazakii]
MIQESITNFVKKPEISFLFIAIYCIYLFTEYKKNKNNNYFEMTEERLTKQNLFKQSIRIPIVSALYFGIFSWIGHYPRFDAVGFSNFIEISKLSIALLSLSIPFVAIVANIHRTIQTENQIRKTQQQIDLVTEKNRSDAYYAHLKNFSDMFKTLPSFTLSRRDNTTFEKGTVKLSVDHTYSLYKKIFKKSSISNGYSNEVDKGFLNLLENTYHNIGNTLIKNNELHRNLDCISNLENLEALIVFLCRELGVNYERDVNNFEIFNPITNLGIETSFSDEKEIKEMLRGLRDILISLYMLIDQNPIIFQGNINSMDFLANYAYDPDNLIFKNILPIRQ